MQLPLLGIVFARLRGSLPLSSGAGFHHEAPTLASLVLAEEGALEILLLVPDYVHRVGSHLVSPLEVGWSAVQERHTPLAAGRHHGKHQMPGWKTEGALFGAIVEVESEAAHDRHHFSLLRRKGAAVIANFRLRRNPAAEAHRAFGRGLYDATFEGHIGLMHLIERLGVVTILRLPGRGQAIQARRRQQSQRPPDVRVVRAASGIEGSLVHLSGLVISHKGLQNVCRVPSSIAAVGRAMAAELRENGTADPPQTGAGPLLLVGQLSVVQAGGVASSPAHGAVRHRQRKSTDMVPQLTLSLPQLCQELLALLYQFLRIRSRIAGGCLHDLRTQQRQGLIEK